MQEHAQIDPDTLLHGKPTGCRSTQRETQVQSYMGNPLGAGARTERPIYTGKPTGCRSMRKETQIHSYMGNPLGAGARTERPRYTPTWETHWVQEHEQRDPDILLHGKFIGCRSMHRETQICSYMGNPLGAGTHTQRARYTPTWEAHWVQEYTQRNPDKLLYGEATWCRNTHRETQIYSTW